MGYLEETELCVVCSEKCSNAAGRKSSRVKAKKVQEGKDPCPTLLSQLRSMFVLQQVFTYPLGNDERLEKMLVEIGNPQEWFRLCRHCVDVIDQAIDLISKIKTLKENLQNVVSMLKEMSSAGEAKRMENFNNGPVLGSCETSADAKLKMELLDQIRTLRGRITITCDIVKKEETAEPAPVYHVHTDDDWADWEGSMDATAEIEQQTSNPSKYEHIEESKPCIEVRRDQGHVIEGQGAEMGTITKGGRRRRQRNTRYWSGRNVRNANGLQQKLEMSMMSTNPEQDQVPSQKHTVMTTRMPKSARLRNRLVTASNSRAKQRLNHRKKFRFKEPPKQKKVNTVKFPWKDFMDLTLFPYPMKREEDRAKIPKTNWVPGWNTVRENGESPVGDFTCPACEKCFKTNYFAIAHIQFAHFGLRPWRCNKCSNKYERLASLQAHIQRHEISNSICVEGASLSVTDTIVIPNEVNEAAFLGTPTELEYNNSNLEVDSEAEDPTFDLARDQTDIDSDKNSDDDDYNKSLEVRASNEERKTTIRECDPAFRKAFFARVMDFLDLTLFPYPVVSEEDRAKIPSTPKAKIVLRQEEGLNKNGEFGCPSCKKRFTKTYFAIAHIQLAHFGLKPWRCDQCQKTCACARNLRRHLVMHEEGVLKVCPICKSYKNTSENRMKIHVIGHKKESTNPTCEQCNKTFDSFKKYALHWEEQHGVNYFKSKEPNTTCEMCGSRVLKRHFDFHKFSIHGVGNNDCGRFPICADCGECFSDERFLQRHQKKFHTEHNEKFVCHECGKECISENNLQYHMKCQHKENPQNCKFCSLLLNNDELLRKHIVVHHEETLKLSLEETEAYIVEKNAVKPFSCRACPQSFSFHVQLYHHYRNEHEEITEKYKCSECGKGFSRQSSVKRHFDAVHSSSVYPCACGRTYKSLNMLRVHSKLYCALTKKKNDMAKTIPKEPLESTSEPFIGPDDGIVEIDPLACSD